MDDVTFQNLSSPFGLQVNVTSLVNNPDYVKCPRCWHYHTVKLNHDDLCDRCCSSILSGWPEHESAPHIKEKLEIQRRMFKEQP